MTQIEVGSWVSFSASKGELSNEFKGPFRVISENVSFYCLSDQNCKKIVYSPSKETLDSKSLPKDYQITKVEEEDLKQMLQEQYVKVYSKTNKLIQQMKGNKISFFSAK